MKQSAIAAFEEMRASVTISVPSYVADNNRRERCTVVCPKPRRLGVVSPSVADPIKSLPSSPPFFCGSPPSRVSNPLIQDARFGDERVTPVSPRAIPIPSGLGASPSSARMSGGCVRANFGNNPAVRIEGFDCLDRDRRNCSIPALA
ncbi:hypothetical protein M9H77_08572 [Catharanthus roseus]|uniref:Uncharacterized protein n=1 Tax=Catharanthus roseus TaxID=4058 RepID=A0ACC0BYE3_CATRO|nr:hypothetical protein M9H77_08572 [Catharanthus roseus]